MGDLARRLFDANGWRRLGYGSESQYARERVGCSLASLRARITLSRRMATMPAIREEMVGGSIGFEAAALVGRVSTVKTVRAWLERAKERTFRHLKEEVEVLEMIARAGGNPGALEDGPPDDETLEAVRAVERRVLSGGIFQMSGGPAALEGDDFQMADGPRTDFQMSGGQEE